jgi:hypothetical protein
LIGDAHHAKTYVISAPLSQAQGKWAGNRQIERPKALPRAARHEGQ